MKDEASHLLTATQEEIALFKFDFEIVMRKIVVLMHALLESVPNIVIAILIFGLFFLLGKLSRRVILKHATVPFTVKLVLERIIGTAFTVLGLFIALAVVFPSIEPVDLLGGVGVISLAIGFAVKNVLNNFLSGILILLQQPFKVGDEIKHKELEGIVDFINIRYTVLIAYDGRKFLIPNGEIYSNLLVVNTLSNYRKTQFDIMINQHNDVDKVIKTLQAIIENVDCVLKEPATSVAVSNIKGNFVTLRCTWATSPFNHDIARVRGQVLKEIQESLKDSDIDLFSHTYAAIAEPSKEKADEGGHL